MGYVKPDGAVEPVKTGGQENGAPIIALQREPHGAWRVPAGAKLSAAEYRRFLAGDLYANVHCAKHPDGMIRGQLRP